MRRCDRSGGTRLCTRRPVPVNTVPRPTHHRRAPNNVVGALAVDMLCAAMASCETALQLEVCAEALLGILREAQVTVAPGRPLGRTVTGATQASTSAVRSA